MNNEPQQWPSRIPPGKTVALLATLVFLYLAVFKYWMPTASVLQQLYLVDYARASVADPFPIFSYHAVLNARGEMMVDGDDGSYTIAKLKVTPEQKPSYAEFLRNSIYGGEPLWSVLMYPLVATWILFCVLMGFGIWIDRQRNNEARHGQLIRGPRVVSKWQFSLPFWLGKKKKGLYIESR